MLCVTDEPAVLHAMYPIKQSS